MKIRLLKPARVVLSVLLFSLSAQAMNEVENLPRSTPKPFKKTSDSSFPFNQQRTDLEENERKNLQLRRLGQNVNRDHNLNRRHGYSNPKSPQEWLWFYSKSTS